MNEATLIKQLDALRELLAGAKSYAFDTYGLTIDEELIRCIPRRLRCTLGDKRQKLYIIPSNNEKKIQKMIDKIAAEV